MSPIILGMTAVELFLVVLLSALLVAAIVFLVIMIENRRSKKTCKKAAVCLAADVVLMAAAVVFCASHSIYYGINDWYVMSSDIQQITEKYGSPDVGSYTEGKAGRIGYYMYTDNSMVMPDHLPHYYYIEYDESGKACEVYEGLPAGG